MDFKSYYETILHSIKEQITHLTLNTKEEELKAKEHNLEVSKKQVIKALEELNTQINQTLTILKK